LFTYFNPVFRYGWKEIVRCGVDGVLILDLPVEESREEKKILSKAGLKMIYLLAPTSTTERIRLTCKYASGFIYYVSRTGVTGVRESVEKDVKPMVEKIKRFTRLPVAVGFGISKPKHVLEVSRYADAVVVGSAIVSKIGENLGKRDLVSKVARFVKELMQVL
jgi:tryptophan synthase alpha chain